MYSGIKYLHLTIVSPEPQQGRPRHVPKITIVGSGFPHSDIFGSKLVRSSPKLFAAYHVLHRLSVPRHPPNALKTLDRSHYQYSPDIQVPDKPACAARVPMNMIRKTILLQHPSGSQALQDLSLACKMGAFDPNRSQDCSCDRSKPNSPGDMCTVLDIFPTGKIGADRAQPDECLLTMSNNAFDRRRLMPGHQSRKTYLSSDKYSTPFPRKWWSQTGSNRRPPECKSGALPAELWPPITLASDYRHHRRSAPTPGG